MPRQTLSFLMKRFAEVGIRPKAQHGQNFLIDLNLLDVLLDAAQLEPTDVVLEVGTGTGSLTAMMAPRVAEVVTVEVDPQMHQLASEELIDHRNVTLLQKDALRRKHEIDPELMKLLGEKLATDSRRRLKLVANLPYHIATPLVSNLLAGPLTPMSMTITIQKELGERICAEPGTRDYSALSIWVQAQCDCEIVRIMPPSVFWPRPKVDSAIVRIVLNEEKRAAIPDRERFHTFVRSLFLHRRKLLRGVLVSALSDLSKGDVDAILGELDFEPTRRAEELSIAEMLRLSEAVDARRSWQ
jgi:16S rRNA (adenine1518-N6/adenine1519-N6)-dimethyltransferase